MKLLSSPDLPTTIRRFLPRGALLFVWLCCLLGLWGWPKALHAAPTAAPLAQVTCDTSMNVGNTTELNDAIVCYNNITTAGSYAINFSNDITLTTVSTVIDNANPGVALQINGNNKALGGANTYRGLLINPNTYVKIVGLTIRGGKAATSNGGGIYNNGILTVSNSTLSGNSAESFGGGIWNNGTLTVTNSTLSGNSTVAGGGIYNNNNSTLTISNSTFSGNSADNGGGIRNDGTLTVTNSTFSDNNGRALYNTSTGKLTVTNSTFNGNSDGGIYNDSILTVSNSTLSGNSTTGLGGGIYNNGNGTLTMTNSTLSGNSANSNGGGLYLFRGAVTLENTLIANSLRGGDCVNDGSTITQTHNLIEDSATACGITNGANGSIIGQYSALAPLAFNGGSGLQTHALLAFSPAIDKGDAAICAAAPINNLDQIGATRPQGAACDIGALESIPTPVVCNFPATVSTTAELDYALSCYNIQTTSGVYTINFNAAIKLATSSTIINNTTPGVALQINGNDKRLSGANTYRGLEIATNTHVSIDNLRISDGKADTSGGGILNRGTLTVTKSLLSSNSAPNGDGGGIYNTGTGTLTVTNSTLASNSALFRGGAIYNEGTLTVEGGFDGNSAENGGGILNNGTVTAQGTFSNNKATKDGGGLYNNLGHTLTLSNSPVITNSTNNNGGGIYNAGQLTVNNSRFNGNSAPNSDGGGLYNTGAGTLTVTDSTLASNSALFRGGAIYNEGTLTVAGSASSITENSAESGGGIMNNGAVTVQSTFNNNKATKDGGGLYNNSDSTLTINNSNVITNLANNNGGGIYNAGQLNMSNSTLSGNKATTTSGGGILNNGQLTVSNSTLSGNTATNGNGGGIYNNGPLTMTNSTLSGNKATGGGGLYNIDALTLRNTIIANSTGGGDCANNGGTLTGQTHNLIEDSANACGITNGANGSIIGQDPALAPLAFNGGSGPQTHALLAASPAIDKGDAATCAAAPINNRDQIGVVRPQGAACDIGALEYVVPPAVCNFPATVSTTAELNNAISCYNIQTTTGVYTITFNVTITLNTTSTLINNTTPGVALQINGNNKALSGANTYRGLEIAPNTRVTIAGLTIRDGKISDGSGGGILNDGTLTLNNSQLIGNSAQRFGGGIVNNGPLTVSNSTLSGNSAQFAGGILNNGKLTVSNSTLSGNSAQTFGGGLYNNGTLTMTNSTLSGNSTLAGGGIYNNGALTLRNTIIANSTGGDCANSGGTLTGQTHNLLEDSTNACEITNGANDSIVGQDPALAPLAFNGGSGPQTHALLAASPAIDKGDAATCAAAPINNRDQIGVVRPQGAVCDIGALEYALLNKVLTVSKAGSGSGAVTSSPAGINCGTTCNAPFAQNAAVTLTATADAGSTFAGWGGACSDTTATCTVTLDSAKTVIASFNKANGTGEAQKIYLPTVSR